MDDKQPDTHKKKEWKKPELTELEVQETEGGPTAGPDGSFGS